MFNMQALGYMAHIKTVFHFLPNSNKYIEMDDYQGLGAGLKILSKIYIEHMSTSCFYQIPKHKMLSPFQ